MKRKYWYLDGGGTSLDGGRYPSDASYSKGDKYVEFQMTVDAYLALPNRVRFPSEIQRRKGVKKGYKIQSLKQLWNDIDD